MDYDCHGFLCNESLVGPPEIFEKYRKYFIVSPASIQGVPERSIRFDTLRMLCSFDTIDIIQQIADALEKVCN